MLGSFSGAEIDAYLPLTLYIGAESVDCTELFRVPLPDSATVGAVYSAGSAMGMSSLGVSLGGLAGLLDIASAGALASDGAGTSRSRSRSRARRRRRGSGARPAARTASPSSRARRS